MKLISVTDNCPLPRGCNFKEVRTYQMQDGSFKTKTIKISNFRGRFSDWEFFVDSQPFDEK